VNLRDTANVLEAARRRKILSSIAGRTANRHWP